MGIYSTNLHGLHLSETVQSTIPHIVTRHFINKECYQCHRGHNNSLPNRVSSFNSSDKVCQPKHWSRVSPLSQRSVIEPVSISWNLQSWFDGSEIAVGRTDITGSHVHRREDLRQFSSAVQVTKINVKFHARIKVY